GRRRHHGEVVPAAFDRRRDWRCRRVDCAPSPPAPVGDGPVARALRRAERMGMSEKVKLLDGWGEISKVLTEAAGVEVSTDQARRYARSHGLPVERRGPGIRKRVVAKMDAVVEWCVREFG